MVAHDSSPGTERLRQPGLHNKFQARQSYIARPIKQTNKKRFLLFLFLLLENLRKENANCQRRHSCNYLGWFLSPHQSILPALHRAHSTQQRTHQCTKANTLFLIFYERSDICFKLFSFSIGCV